MKYLKEIVLLFGMGQLFAPNGDFWVFLVAACFCAVLIGVDSYKESSVYSKAISSAISAVSSQIGVLVSRVNFLEDGQRDKSASVDAELTSIKESLADLLKNQATVKTMAEESKKFLSQANLGLGFRATKRE